MRKIFKIFSIVFIICLLVCGKQTSHFSLNNYFKGNYFVYTSEPTENCLNLGFCYMNNKIINSNKIIGESIEVENLEIGSAIKKLKANVVKTEMMPDGTTCVYCYTNKINKTVKIDGKTVNLQFAFKNEHCVVGWPLILGSY